MTRNVLMATLSGALFLKEELLFPRSSLENSEDSICSKGFPETDRYDNSSMAAVLIIVGFIELVGEDVIVGQILGLADGSKDG